MSELGKIIDRKTIRFERVVAGPIERVWDYLTRPELIATWLATGEIELRVGGRVELQTMGGVVRGVVTRCDPPRALAYTWIADGSEAMRPAGEDLESILSFELTAHGVDQVVLVLTHRPIWDGFMGRTGSGWHTILERLGSAMRGEEPAPFMEIFNRVIPDYERLASSTKESG